MKPESLNEQVVELLLQSLEHEKGGVQVYQTALKCAVNEDLKEEWQEYLEQTEHHVEVLTEACGKLGIDPDEGNAGRAGGAPHSASRWSRRWRWR